MKSFTIAGPALKCTARFKRDLVFFPAKTCNSFFGVLGIPTAPLVLEVFDVMRGRGVQTQEEDQELRSYLNLETTDEKEKQDN